MCVQGIEIWLGIQEAGSSTERQGCQEKWLWNNGLFPCHLCSDLLLYWLHLASFLKVKDPLSSSVLAWSPLISINKSPQDRGVKNSCTYWLLHFRGAELFPAIKGNLSFLGSVKIWASNNSVSYFTALQGLSCCSLIALFLTFVWPSRDLWLTVRENCTNLVPCLVSNVTFLWMKCVICSSLMPLLLWNTIRRNTTWSTGITRRFMAGMGSHACIEVVKQFKLTRHEKVGAKHVGAKKTEPQDKEWQVMT